jgi:hypothetical protein
MNTMIGSGFVAASVTVAARRSPSCRSDFPLTESDMLIGEDYMHARRFWLSYATKMLFVQPLRRVPSITLHSARLLSYTVDHY